MKNTIKFLGIIAIAAIIGLALAGCEGEHSSCDNDGKCEKGKSADCKNYCVSDSLLGTKCSCP